MDDPVTKFLTAQREFGERVRAVGEQQWDHGTPDTEWSVADLVAHMIEEHRYAGPLLHGQDLEGARLVVEGSRSMPVDGGVGANLAQEWAEAAVESADAFASDGALGRSVALSRGPTPAGVYIGEMILDLVVHAWDLGVAIGYDRALPEDLVQEVYDDIKPAGDMSASGMMNAPVDVPDDAPAIDKLVAQTGRSPR